MPDIASKNNLQTNIRKDWGLWPSPWYKWPAVISQIFWNWPSLYYKTRFSAEMLRFISQLFKKIVKSRRWLGCSAENAFYLANSANIKKFVESLQVICTRDSAKVLNPHCQFSGFSFILFLVSFLVKKCATQIFLWNHNIYF